MARGQTATSRTLATPIAAPRRGAAVDDVSSISRPSRDRLCARLSSRLRYSVAMRPAPDCCDGLPRSGSHLQLALDLGRKRLPGAEQMRDGPRVHLLHHVAAMELHRDFADAEIERDLLVQRTGDHKPQHLPLARRKRLVKRRVLSRYGSRPLFGRCRPRWPSIPRRGRSGRAPAWSGNRPPPPSSPGRSWRCRHDPSGIRSASVCLGLPGAAGGRGRSDPAFAHRERDSQDDRAASRRALPGPRKRISSRCRPNSATPPRASRTAASSSTRIATGLSAVSEFATPMILSSGRSAGYELTEFTLAIINRASVTRQLSCNCIRRRKRTRRATDSQGWSIDTVASLSQVLS